MYIKLANRITVSAEKNEIRITRISLGKIRLCEGINVGGGNALLNRRQNEGGGREHRNVLSTVTKRGKKEEKGRATAEKSGRL